MSLTLEEREIDDLIPVDRAMSTLEKIMSSTDSKKDASYNVRQKEVNLGSASASWFIVLLEKGAGTGDQLRLYAPWFGPRNPGPNQGA
jgi:hypothetical protein